MTVPYGTADMKDIWCLLYIILQAPVSWKVLNLIVSQLDGEFHGYAEQTKADKSKQNLLTQLRIAINFPTILNSCDTC